MGTTIPRTVVELLQRMVSVPSVNTAASGNPTAEAALVDHNEQVARAMGLQTRRLPNPGRADNLLIWRDVDPARPWVMFESHLDTVTAEGMTVDPFAGEVREGRLYGRGSCDTKATAACALWAMHELAGRADLPNNFALLQVIDEEYGMTGVRAYVNQHRRQIPWTPRLIVVGEPTMLRPVIAHNGCARWRVTTRGTAAHSSTPNLGRSAISAMVRVIAELETRYIPSLAASHPMTGKAQASINLIQGGSQINIIPDQCWIDMDRRIVPGEDVDAVEPGIEKHLAGLRASHPQDAIERRTLFQCPPLDPRTSEAALPVVQQVLRSLGLPVDPVGGAYATDAGDLGAAGLPAVVIGPGSLAQAHTCDEFISIDQLQRGLQLYRAIMLAELNPSP